MFAHIAWTSLIIYLGNLRASISGKSGHAFIVYRGFDVDRAQRVPISACCPKAISAKNAKQRRESSAD